MPSASFAEWLLARFTNQARAASIVGDLLEAAPQKGKLWFWLSVVRVLFSLAWRRPLAYAVMIGVVICWTRSVRFTVFNGPAFHILSQQWIALELYVYRANAFLSAGLAYTAIRYGAKDSFVRRIAVLWILFQTLIFFGTTSAVAVTCGLLAACALVYSFSSATGRKGLLALAIAVTLCIGWLFVANFFREMLFGGIRVGSKVISSYGILDVLRLGYTGRAWVLTLIWLFILTLICARVHRLFFENNSRDAAPEAAAIS
jgi:hypothetical protein